MRRAAGISMLVAAPMLSGAWQSALAGEEAWTRFDAHLEQCAQREGYYPDRVKVGPKSLAPREREWRECAYQGVRDILIPGSGLEDAFTRIIVQDKVMTDRIEKGEMTRSERSDRLDKLIADVRRAESQRITGEQKKSQEDFERDQEMFNARMKDLDRMNRLNRIMR